MENLVLFVLLEVAHECMIVVVLVNFMIVELIENRYE